MSREQQRKSARLGLVPAALGVGAALVLAGCGAGQITQTDTQVAAVNGAEGRVGSIAVRGVEFVYPASGENHYPVGSDAPLLLTIANEGTAGDELVSVTSPVAGNVRIEGSTEGSITIPAGHAIVAKAPESTGATTSAPVVVTTTPNADTTGEASATGEAGVTTDTTQPEAADQTESSAPSVTGTTAADTQPTGTTTTPGGGESRPSVGTVYIVFTDLTQPIQAGVSVPVTLVFRNAGEITLQVPIAAPAAPRSGAAGYSGNPAPGSGGH